jgi:hypothetical protein
LPVPFDAVPEDLVKEDARRASGKNRRTDKRLGLGRPQQRRDVVGHAVDGRQQHFVVGQPGPSTASKVSNVLRSVPSAALAEAVMITRAKPRPCSTRVPPVSVR